MERKDKIALITGAAGNGMGRSIAFTLAREGISVVINYLKNQKNAEIVTEYINNNGGKAIAVQGNIFNKSECEKLVDTVIDRCGKIDICVIGPGADWNPENLINLKSENALNDITQEISPVYNLLPLVLKDMNKRKWGRIIGIASNMSIPSPSYSYNSAKSARIDALKLTVNEAWKMGVTVNIIAPGPVEHIPDIAEAYDCCCHKIGWTERKNISPQDIAEGVAFLCSDSAKYVSGCVLPYLF